MGFLFLSFQINILYQTVTYKNHLRKKSIFCCQERMKCFFGFWVVHVTWKILATSSIFGDFSHFPSLITVNHKHLQLIQHPLNSLSTTRKTFHRFNIFVVIVTFLFLIKFNYPQSLIYSCWRVGHRWFTIIERYVKQ